MTGGPPRTVIVGSGFAGVAAAVELVKRGHHVTVLEARRRPGGRASSWTDEESGETLDNGQHLLMGCYSATRRLLRDLGTERLVSFQKRLSIVMLEEGGQAARLRCPPLPAPLHLLAGLLAFKGLEGRDKIALLRAAPRLMRLSGEGLTVEAWLDELGQTENLCDRFWRPLAVAALNEDTRLAGAELLTGVLNVAFGEGAAGSGLGHPAVGLGDLHAGPAETFLREHGSVLQAGVPVERIEVEHGEASAVRTREGETIPCDGVVLAVPHTAVARILPDAVKEADPKLERAADLGTSAIASVNVWLDRKVTDHPFFGQIGGTVQFVFDKGRLWDQERVRGTYLACVISAASSLRHRPNEDVAAAAVEELRRYLPRARGARVLRTMVVREKQATFSGRPGVLYLRPGPATALPNLALAGDWTDTGLPGTIEGAVRSGVAAARILAGR